MPQNLEPLLPDERVARIERVIRLQHPRLPMEATFVTYYQEPTTRVTEDGIEVPVEAQAVFGFIMRNPRHPEFDKMILGRAAWSQWHPVNRGYRHSSEVAADPAYHQFVKMVPDAVRWWENMKALTPLPKKKEPFVLPPNAQRLT